MNSRTYPRLREIRRRAHRKRRRRENRILSGLTLCSIALITGMGTLLHHAGLPGIVSVSDGYGAILLRQGASAYIVVGVAAFALGALLTIFCIRARKSSPSAHTPPKESEESQ